MNSLIEKYNSVVNHVKEINTQIENNKQAIQELKASRTVDVSARISNLEEQIVKIDDYLLKIKGFQELAKKNLESQNVLTIEAPPGYRVNLNRLRNWAMMIDPMSSNDPYAQRVYVTAKCDECFLEQKKKEFSDRVSNLKAEQSNELPSEITELEQTINSLVVELDNYAMSDEVIDFAKAVVEENNRCWQKTSPEMFANAKTVPETFSPGAYAAPLLFNKNQREKIKNFFENYYDVDSARVLLPIELPNDKESIITITCTPARSKELDAGIQNLVLGKINANPAGLQKIYVIDGSRFNTVSMGSLKKLEGTFAMEQIPRNPEQLTASLENIVSSFADLDEILELRDSIEDYNSEVEDSKKLALSTLILYGWPSAYQGRDRELIQRIMTNYERYGVSIITVSYSNSEKEYTAEKMCIPEYAFNNAVHISMLMQKSGNAFETFVSFAGSEPQRFKWYSFNGELSSEYVDSLKNSAKAQNTIGNEYIKRYPLSDFPTYERKYKAIDLPFGIDGKDVAHSVSFENENFATYLVGASRSGKSTLIHTLIAGLIRNYHPDNVELWLADFKQLEFKKYIENCPPHVKYVLLDESTELVYDLIDKLTDKMMERQRIFSVLRIERIDQIKDPSTLDEPLPVIFVILDEFSIMSQAIAESQTYRLKLQNLLAKGAALGIKFLFSSQTFTTGVVGLTPTARAQIQQRISMKGSKEEITETLELSANLKTEQVLNWIDALPPHYALVKFRAGADLPPQVKRFYVMYFKDYEPRDEFIKTINSNMHRSDVYDVDDINSYVDKHPVFVDGNSFDKFPSEKFNGNISVGNNEVAVSLGVPRLMDDFRLISFSQETRENMLLIGRGAEQSCIASIVSSVIRCFLLQNKKVSVWAYDKNSIYRQCKNDVWKSKEFDKMNFYEGMDQVCTSISDYKKKIQSKESTDELIVLLGMDRIYSDFDFFESSSGQSTVNIDEKVREQENQLIQKGVIATDEKNVVLAERAQQWAIKRSSLKKKLKASGKTEQEISEELTKAMKEFFDSFENTTSPTTEKAPIENNDYRQSDANNENNGSYNASEDFQYVVKQGSRFGKHFLVVLNNFSDIKTAGVRLDWFRHRMAFQISNEDSRELFNSKVAGTLPAHICQYSDSISSFSIRPYLHKGIEWDGWTVDDDENVVKPY